MYLRLPDLQEQERGMSENDGYFYVVQFLPEDAPHVLKLGYSKNPQKRLLAYKVICTAARILKSWPCSAQQEQLAIAFITGTKNSQAIGAESYRVKDIKALLARADDFFLLSAEEREGIAHKRKLWVSAIPETVKCANPACQNTFPRWKSKDTQRFCSHSCYSQASGRAMMIRCANPSCGRMFKRKENETRRFCSLDCVQ